MKKVIFALSLLFFSVAVMAQEDVEEFEIEEMAYNNYFGIKAGANYSGIHSDDFETEYLIGPNVGLFFESKQRGMFGLLAELNYSQKGGTLTPDGADEGTEFDIKYLDIPLMLTFYPIKNLGISAGLQPSIVLDATVDGEEVESISEDDIYGYFFPMYFGFVAGVNYKISPSFNVDLKYNPRGLFTEDIWVDAVTLRVGYAISKY